MGHVGWNQRIVEPPPRTSSSRVASSCRGPSGQAQRLKMVRLGDQNELQMAQGAFRLSGIQQQSSKMDTYPDVRRLTSERGLKGLHHATVRSHALLLGSNDPEC